MKHTIRDLMVIALASQIIFSNLRLGHRENRAPTSRTRRRFRKIDDLVCQYFIGKGPRGTRTPSSALG
jgi:hypothetical protein